jgi:hypothetical protein
MARRTRTRGTGAVGGKSGRLTVSVPRHLTKQLYSSASIVMAAERYVTLMREIRSEDLLSVAEWRVADTALEDWVTSPAEMVSLTAVRVADASGKASDAFIKKLGGMTTLQLMRLADELERRRSEAQK